MQIVPLLWPIGRQTANRFYCLKRSGDDSISVAQCKIVVMQFAHNQAMKVAQRMLNALSPRPLGGMVKRCCAAGDCITASYAKRNRDRAHSNACVSVPQIRRHAPRTAWSVPRHMLPPTDIIRGLRNYNLGKPTR